MAFATQLADGPGCPVVASHALGLDSTMWEGWAATQAGRRPVLAYDHRGHGRTPKSPGRFTMDDLVDDAARVVADWGRGPVVFMGLSMGGMVAQGLGIRRPELVRGLVLANTTSVYPAAAKAAWAQRVAAVRAGGMASVADMVVQRYLTEDFRRAHPDVAARIKAKILANDPEAYAACCEAVAGVDWTDRLARIACPALVLAGALDAGATPDMAREIAGRIPGARLTVLERASHLSVEEEPEAFHAAVEDFLAAIDTKEES